MISNGESKEEVNCNNEIVIGEKVSSPQPIVQKRKKVHPLKMPLRISPYSGKPICRFHNYSIDKKKNKENSRKMYSGCKKHQDGMCQDLDHDTCHICLEDGHIALDCPTFADDNQFHIFMQTFTLKNTRPENYPTKTVFGNPIVWIKEYLRIHSVNAQENHGLDDDCEILEKERIKNKDSEDDVQSTSIQTKPSASSLLPKGFQLGDDQLLRCKQQKRIEGRYLLSLDQNASYVDVGCHMGDSLITMALYARHQSRNDLRFFGMEPDSKKCQWIQWAIQQNNLQDQVTIWNVAVGNDSQRVVPAQNAKERALRDGSLMYEAVKTTSTKQDQSSREQEMQTFSASDSIAMITLDSVRNEISPLGILHIDVEGWEPQVLTGAKNLLISCTSTPCFLIAEAWTEKECQRRGVIIDSSDSIPTQPISSSLLSGHERRFRKSPAEHRIEEVMKSYPNFQRSGDIVDIERNMVYERK